MLRGRRRLVPEVRQCLLLCPYLGYGVRAHWLLYYKGAHSSHSLEEHWQGPPIRLCFGHLKYKDVRASGGTNVL